MKTWTNQGSTQPISSARGEMKVGYRSLCYRACDYPGFIWNSGAAASFLYRNTNRRFSFAGWFTKNRVQGHASVCLCHAIVCLVSVANPANENLRFLMGAFIQRGECAVTVSRRCYAARGIIARRVAGTSASHHVNLNDMFDWAGNGSDDVL